MSRIFVAGHRGLVGSAIVRALEARGEKEVLKRTHEELDLLDQAAVRAFFQKERPARVIMAAARVGGILANATMQADFIYENITMASNVIKAAADFGTEKLLFLGSSCIYPKLAPQPLKEEYLLTGPLEPTNEGYAIAKIAGLRMCDFFHQQYGKKFFSAMPTNLYGPGDNFHPLNSHVIPGLLRRFHEAKLEGAPSVKIWGSGKPLREFLHVDDLAEGLLLMLDRFEGPGFMNVGTGEEVTIRQLAELMKEVTQYEGKLEWDSSKPDGTPRKVMDSSKIRSLGWQPKISLRDGLKATYEWALQTRALES